MTDRFTREMREEKIQHLTEIFRSSRLFRGKPGPREDIKPGLARSLAQVVDSQGLAEGERISSGLVRSALQELGWKLSDSTVSMVLWHLGQNGHLDYDGQYYIVPARWSHLSALDVDSVLEEVGRKNKNRAVFTLIADARTVSSADDRTPESPEERARERLGAAGGGGLHNLNLIRLESVNEKNDEGRLVLTHSLFAFESYWWSVGLCDQVLEDYRSAFTTATAQQRRSAFAFRPGTRAKWKVPSFAQSFHDGYHAGGQDGLLYPGPRTMNAGPHIRVMRLNEKIETVLQETYGIALHRTEGAVQYAFERVSRSSREHALYSLAVLAEAPELELGDCSVRFRQGGIPY